MSSLASAPNIRKRPTASEKRPQKKRNEKWKIALVPILLIVLVGAVLNNLRSSDSEATVTLAERPCSPSAAEAGPGTAGAKVARQEDRVASAKNLSRNASETSWPDVSDDELGIVNPFEGLAGRETNAGSPDGSAPVGKYVSTPANPSWNNPKDQLGSLPMRYYFQSGNRRVMMVGDQLITEGQQISDGYVVRELGIDKIVLGSPQEGEQEKPQAAKDGISEY